MGRRPPPSFTVSRPEPASFTPKLEDILTSQQAKLMQKAETGTLPCPQCESPLTARRKVTPGYNGLVLACPSCGFKEE